MVGVDPVVAYSVGPARQVAYRQAGRRLLLAGLVLVVDVSPHQDRQHTVVVAGGQHVDLFGHAAAVGIVQLTDVPGHVGGRLDPLGAQQRQHPVRVQQRLLDPAGGEERPGALEVPLALEVEAP